MADSGITAYVAQIDRVLAAGEALFPMSRPDPGAVDGQVPTVPTPPAGSGLARGAGTDQQGYRQRLNTVSALDDQTNSASGQGSAQAQNGRSAATAVRRDAAVTAAAIAPATGSPAGLRQLVSSMDERLAAMQRHITSSESQNRALATQLNDTAAGYRSIPTAYVSPKPPPDPATTPLCWIGTEDGDVAAICPPNTEDVSYVDKDGNYVIKNLRTGEVTVWLEPGPERGSPTSCWLASRDADRSICGPATTSWSYPQDGYLITEELGPDGQIRIKFRTPLGPLIP